MLPDAFRGKTACCFSGHRPYGLPDAGREASPSMERLKYALLHAVEEAARLGVTTFLAGGAEGFDLLAAEAVLACRGDYPNTRLILSLPSRTQTERFSEPVKARYERVHRAAADVYYASESDNGFMAMRRRNRYLVEHADCCIAYLKSMHGGTFYTVNYALERGLPIFNLYEFIISC